ncbi:hypothetical protein AVEN_17690-1, partial [Araneus ventricosus]
MYVDLLHVKSYVGGQKPPANVVQEFLAPAQVSSSSADRDSKLR